MSVRRQAVAAAEREWAALAVLPGLLAERSALAAINAALVRPHQHPLFCFERLLMLLFLLRVWLRPVRW